MTSPDPVIAGAWRVVIKGTYLGKPVYNSLGFLGNVGQPVTVAAAQQIADDFSLAWRTHVMPALSDAYSVNSVSTYSLQDLTIGALNATTGAGGQSAATNGGAVTSALCANVRLTTGRRGRSFRGRTGLTGLNEGDVQGNELVAGTQSRITLAFSNFRSDIGDDATNIPGSLAIVSFAGPGYCTPVTSHGVAATVGTRVARLR